MASTEDKPALARLDGYSPVSHGVRRRSQHEGGRCRRSFGVGRFRFFFTRAIEPNPPMSSGGSRLEEWSVPYRCALLSSSRWAYGPVAYL